MGDDELNFTEEEARIWADDPRNQTQDGGSFGRQLVLCILLVVAVLAIIWLASSELAQNHAALKPVRGPLPLGL